jgi:phosphatidylserine/phosphatidylglycerophosphate/cardiolipin synthase-like enzyme
VSERRHRILEEGVSCWRVAPAGKVAVLIDAAAYFQALLSAWRKARARIMILGWDFDPGIRLDPTDPATELRRLLRALVEDHPQLHLYLLIWDISVLFGPSEAGRQLIATNWQAHPRIHFRFDGRHPVGAAHHEKIVTVDDELAFAGGIDLTVERWDTPEHQFDRATRRDPGGEPYDPVHDVQLALDGAAARAVAELARARWVAATGEALAPCDGSAALWPDDLAPALTDVDVGIARTQAAMEGRPEVNEVAALNVAALAAARRSVYIETQYLAAPAIADRLALLLERPDGPEIVLVIWRQAIGWIERFAMGSNRDRLMRRLAAADRHGRLRAYWLGEPAAPNREIDLHAKLIIVDDVFLRIGSSNLNNRSLGFDSECDLAIEALDAASRAGIAAVRNRLLAEHLVRPAEEVGQTVAADGLIAAIDRLNPGHGRLRRYEVEPEAGPREPLAGSALLDPAEPLDLEYLGRSLRRLFTG